MWVGRGSVIDAARHIMRFREHVRDLKLVEKYSNGRIKPPQKSTMRRINFNG
ncbi:hypothetical protein [Vulcanisaeta distributa]|uniref:hypothetical protein n=1 Tax=Vulcanisaeta distributa TaxID=164451 RepID=UPI001FB347C5|nr:hypothetical protein [Vulcanisaeta distributa]